MKTFALIFLFCASLYGADTTMTTNTVGDLTTKVMTHSGKAGAPDRRMETVYRGKAVVLQTLSRPNKQGVMAITARSYFAGDKLAMTELDEDGDGVFEDIAVYRDGTDDLELFKRQPDGSVQPAETRVVQLANKQIAVVDELVQATFQTNKLSDPEIGTLLENARQKIQDLEKEKTDKK